MTPLPMMPKSDTRADADLLSRTHVAKPCPADWAQMTGDDKSRFCGSCKKNVYNLSAMTATEAANLIREKEGKLCIRYYQRADGTILTQDCPVGVAAFQRKVRRAFAASIVGAASVMMMFTEAMRFATDKPSLFAERLQVWAERVHPQEERTMGAVAPIESTPITAVAGDIAIRSVEPPAPVMGEAIPTQGYAGTTVAEESYREKLMEPVMGQPQIQREVRGRIAIKK